MFRGKYVSSGRGILLHFIVACGGAHMMLVGDGTKANVVEDRGERLTESRCIKADDVKLDGVEDDAAAA